MKLLGNVLWIIFGGLLSALGYFLVGIFLCITIIGIPFGKQMFKYAKIMLTPFGREVELDFSKHPVANVLWLIICGWSMFIYHIGIGIICCITIIGIPFGLQWFKLAVLAIAPFGAKIK